MNALAGLKSGLTTGTELHLSAKCNEVYLFTFGHRGNDLLGCRIGMLAMSTPAGPTLTA